MIFLLLVMLTGVFASEECALPGEPYSQTLDQLYQDVEKATEKSYKPIMQLSIKMDGGGAFSIVEEDGKVVGLRFDYRDRKGKLSSMALTLKEINEGKQLDYSDKDYPTPAVVLKKREKLTGTNLPLTFRYRTGLPDKYKNFDVEIKKKGDEFKVFYQGKVVSAVELVPGINFMSWDGTFKKESIKYAP